MLLLYLKLEPLKTIILILKHRISLQGYQLLHGVKGKTLKSGCGFYLKSGIKFKPRKDLNISFFDENNEFQSCWIEVLMKTNQIF